MNIDDTFILFNKQMKGNKRELIQFGIPIFGHIKEEHEDNNRTSMTLYLSFSVHSWYLNTHVSSPVINFLTDFSWLTVDVEPIPALLQHVVDHLIQWKLIPEYKKPNGCVINFFDEVLINCFPFQFCQCIAFHVIWFMWSAFGCECWFYFEVGSC